MIRMSSIWLVLVVALLALPLSGAAQQTDAGPTVRVPDGETREGDLYATGELIEVAGRLNGDLIAAGQRIQTTGPVSGDLFAAGRTIDIRGSVGDSTRVAGEQISLDATIDGDFVTAGNRCEVFEGARITGGLLAACATVQLDGTIDGDVRAAGGEVIIDGTIRGDTHLLTDRVTLGPGARIIGDLDYRARTPLSPEEAARVQGTVSFDEVEEEDSGLSFGGLIFWGWQTTSALVAGLLAVLLFRRVVPQLISAIADNTTAGALIGFAAFLLIPAAVLMAMITVVGIPVGISALLLFLVVLYLAKLPIAAWAGGRLLGAAGHPDASPYAAMGLGIIALYLLFAIPFLGWLIWLAATWLGLGAMVLAGRAYLAAPN